MATVLSVRTVPAGGPVAPEVQPRDFVPLRSRLTLLIHGFNNTQGAADQAYGAFLRLSELESLPGAGQVCRFFWPGDARLGPLSFLSYPTELAPALDSGARLHAFLQRLPVPGGWPLEVVLVCHSLGNRVGLEILRTCLEAGNPGGLRFPRACFMAAAVPVFRLEPGGSLERPARSAAPSLVLCSRSDLVLTWAFPLGQTAAGDGFFPRAVGREGEPGASLWGQDPLPMPGFGHSDYWTRQESARQVAAYLGRAEARGLPQTAIAPRGLPGAAPGRSRELPKASGGFSASR